MLNLQMCVSKGTAIFRPEGLRCGASREKEPDRKCNKLLVKKNRDGLVAGNYRCERCGQEIEITLRAGIAA